MRRPTGLPAVFLARYDDRLRRAQQMADWIDETLIDPETHLVFDGIKAGSLVRAQYTYCQGVVLGLETELAARTDDARHAERVHRLVAAVAEHMAPDGIIKGAGGGDGGLFNGILARYLALVATALPGDGPRPTRRHVRPPRRWCSRRRRAAWDNRQTVEDLPLFAAFWDRDAELPTAGTTEAQFVEGAVNSSEIPERDLSVQLSGWMLMEAAHTSTHRERATTDRRVTEPTTQRGFPLLPSRLQPRQPGHQDDRQHRGGTAAGVHRHRDPLGEFAMGGQLFGAAGHARRVQLRRSPLRDDGQAPRQRRA